MRFFLFVLLNVFFVSSAFADSLPSWARRAPSETSSMRFYTGFGEGETKSKAINAAVADAQKQALATFGIFIESSEETYETTRSSALSAVSSEKSAANLVEFNRKDTFSQKNGKLWEAYVLYSYPKNEIEKERKRLDNLKKNGVKAEKSVIGSDRSKGVLIVDTNGVRASLYIDGRSFGYTPVELIGQLSAGEHKVRIDDPIYEVFEHSVIIMPNKTVKLPVRLKNAFGFVTLRTNGKKSDVLLDGKKIGKTPLVNYKVPAGKELTFEIRNSETERSFQSVTLDRNEEREINIALQEKKAKISVYSFPESDAYILLDGRKTGLKTPLENHVVPAGNHKITIYKDGFENSAQTFSVKGGEIRKLSLTMAKLKRDISKKLLFDKAHTFTLYPSTTVKKPALAGIRVEEKLSRLMKWNAAFQFLKARTAFNDKSGKVFLTVYIDEQAYKRNYTAPMIAALSDMVAGDTEEKRLPLNCFGGGACGLTRLKTDSDVYLRLGGFRHYFWSDKADYMRFPIMHMLSTKSIEQTVSLEAYFAALDANNKSVATGVFPFQIRNWQMNGGNIVFSPELLTNDAGKCVRRSLLSGKSTYWCGSDSLVFEQKIKAGTLGKISKVFVAIGVKAQ